MLELIRLHHEGHLNRICLAAVPVWWHSKSRGHIQSPFEPASSAHLHSAGALHSLWDRSSARLAMQMRQQQCQQSQPSHPSSQGNCILVGAEELEEVAGVPPSAQAHRLDPSLARSILLEQRQRQLAQRRQVAGTMARSHPTLVLPERHFQHPMEAVLDPPVTPHRLGNRFGLTRQTPQGGADGRRRFLLPDPAGHRSSRSGRPRPLAPAGLARS